MNRRLDSALERTVHIRAPRETVFRYFTDSSRWAAWWGAGSSIDAVPGGSVLVRYPNGVEAAGEVIEVSHPERIVFTYGYVSGDPVPPGASRVTIQLDAVGDGTRLRLRHEFAEAGVRDAHVQGWRYQLAVFANVVADDAHAAAAGRVDAWFAAWSEPDAQRRSELLASAVSAGVRFRDRFSLVEGLADLEPHLAAVHVFMPGTRLERVGDTRHCQGTILADWVAHGPDGAERGRGTNVFALAPDGAIEDVVGLWS
jgi:uncharacterized protein YndB with AHSA1/START domain